MINNKNIRVIQKKTRQGKQNVKQMGKIFNYMVDINPNISVIK